MTSYITVSREREDQIIIIIFCIEKNNHFLAKRYKKQNVKTQLYLLVV